MESYGKVIDWCLNPKLTCEVADKFKYDIWVIRSSSEASKLIFKGFLELKGRDDSKPKIEYVKNLMNKPLLDGKVKSKE